jgi:hypothetical protein
MVRATKLRLFHAALSPEIRSFPAPIVKKPAFQQGERRINGR